MTTNGGLGTAVLKTAAAFIVTLAGVFTACGNPWWPQKNGPWEIDPDWDGPAEPRVSDPFTPGARSLSVVYHPMGATSGTAPLDPTPYTAGDEVVVASGTGLEKAGFVFAEWSDHPQFDSVWATSLSEGETFTIEDHTILYAFWLEESRALRARDRNGRDLSGRKHTFPRTEPGDPPPPEEDITVVNTENRPANDLMVSIHGDIHAFDLSPSWSDGDTINIAAAGDLLVTITPKDNMPPGVYSIVVRLDNNDPDDPIRTSFVASFTVKSYPLFVAVQGAVNYNDTAAEYANIGRLTPLVSDNSANPAYTERTATMTVTVAGFKQQADAAGLGFKTTSGISFTPDTGSYSESGDIGTMTYTVTAQYDGSTAFPTLSTNIPLALDNVHPSYNAYAAVVNLNVTDGQAATRAVSVNQTNVAAFNGYAANNGLARHYRQTEDITLAANGGASNWTAIGTNSNAFSGSYDGGGKTITGLTVNVSAAYQGMFGHNTGTLKNIALKGGSVTGGVNATTQAHVGGVVGQNSGGTVDGCYSEGAVTATGYRVGGVVGTNTGGGKVLNSHSKGSVTGNSLNVGGVVGMNTGANSIVQKCYSIGAVHGDYLQIGGVVGLNQDNAKVLECYSTGPVSGDGYSPGGTVGAGVGGVVGHNQFLGEVKDCYSTGPVEGTTQVGGVVGYNDSYNGIPKVENCYSSGAVTGTDVSVGGVVGENKGTVTTSYATGNVTGSTVTGYNQNVGGVVGQNSGAVTSSYATGEVSATGNQIGGVVGENDANGTVLSSYFTGKVNGSGLSIGGIVGSNSGTVEKCFVQNINVTGTQNNVGGIAGWNIGTLQNCYSSGGEVFGTYHVGGVVGKHRDGIVQYCYSTSIVTNDAGTRTSYVYAGGVVGDVDSNGSPETHNNVALNPSVTISGAVPVIGRVIGGSSRNDINYPSNNYARTDMTLTPSVSPANDATSKDGEDIDAFNWNNPYWWEDNVGFSTSVWDFSGVGANKLPTLKGFTGVAQNPEVVN